MPKITRETAQKLVGQFTAFAYLPQSNEGLTLTIDTLIASARSEGHAKAIVQEILDAPGDPPIWPPPHRIRKVAWDLLTDDEKSSGCCERCNGSGFVHTVKRIKGVPYDFSEECSCRVPATPQSTTKPVRDGRMASAADAMEGVVW